MKYNTHIKCHTDIIAFIDFRYNLNGIINSVDAETFYKAFFNREVEFVFNLAKARAIYRLHSMTYGSLNDGPINIKVYNG